MGKIFIIGRWTPNFYSKYSILFVLMKKRKIIRNLLKVVDADASVKHLPPF